MRYTARKILTLLVTMLVVSLLTFAAFAMISGDPAATLLGTQATPEKVEALRTEMGLNRPMLVRYGEWLAGFFTGNLGVSFQYRQPVQALLGPKMLVTLCLSLVSFVLIVVVSLPLGLLSANGKLDGLHTFLNQFCMAVPPFFTGILISWCFGHLAELASAEVYDEAYAGWSREQLPIIPESWQYSVGRDKKKQLDLLTELMRRSDVTEIINACDAGREGELIFRTVYLLAGCVKPVKRLWISSMEDATIREGFEKGERAAALCRRCGYAERFGSR